jgi:HK97 family phage major capsid protein
MSAEINTKLNELGGLVEQLKTATETGRTDLEGKLTAAILDTKKEIDGLKLALAESTRVSNQTEEKARTGYDNEFKSWMRKGTEIKAVQGLVGTPADGGYAVTQLIDTNITRLLQETSDLRQVAKIYNLSGTNNYIHNISQANAGYSWGTETTAFATSNSPTLGQVIITPSPLTATPEVSLQLVEDANFDVESWYQMEVADVIARAENTAFVNGSGTNQPKGFLQYTQNALNTGRTNAVATGLNTITSVTAATISSDDIYALVYSIKPAYRKNACFVMNRTVIQTIMTLKATTGAPLWQQSMQVGQPSTLVGFPVYEFSDMPAGHATGTLAITFGDFSRGYTIVDRVGLTVMRNPYLNPGFVQFYTRKRTGGGLEDGTALTTLIIS